MTARAVEPMHENHAADMFATWKEQPRKIARFSVSTKDQADPDVPVNAG